MPTLLKIFHSVPFCLWKVSRYHAVHGKLRGNTNGTLTPLHNKSRKSDFQQIFVTFVLYFSLLVTAPWNKSKKHIDEINVFVYLCMKNSVLLERFT